MSHHSSTVFTLLWIHFYTIFNCSKYCPFKAPLKLESTYFKGHTEHMEGNSDHSLSMQKETVRRCQILGMRLNVLIEHIESSKSNWFALVHFSSCSQNESNIVYSLRTPHETVHFCTVLGIKLCEWNSTYSCKCSPVNETRGDEMVSCGEKIIKISGAYDLLN